LGLILARVVSRNNPVEKRGMHSKYDKGGTGISVSGDFSLVGRKQMRGETGREGRREFWRPKVMIRGGESNQGSLRVVGHAENPEFTKKKREVGKLRVAKRGKEWGGHQR